MHRQRMRAERDYYRDAYFAIRRRERDLLDFLGRLKIIFEGRPEDDHLLAGVIKALDKNTSDQDNFLADERDDSSDA